MTAIPASDTIRRILYFTNLYPAVSHTFICTEADSVRRLGFIVEQASLGGDPDLIEDFGQTTFLVGTRLALYAMKHIVRRPVSILQTCGWAAVALRGRGIGAIRLTRYLIAAAALAAYAAAVGADLVRIHFGTNAALIARLARRMGAPPYSVAYHGPEEFERPERWDIAGTVADSTFVTGISEYCVNLIRQSAPRSTHAKIVLLPMAVADDFFEDVPLPPMPLGLCFVGRLVERKGLRHLLGALQIVISSGGCCALEVIGEGPEMDDMAQLVKNADLASFVRFSGALSSREVRGALARSHLLVLPSTTEGLPVVLMEAMAMGRPVVATKVGAITELVEDERSGWLVQPGDVAELAARLRECCECSTEKLAAMGAAARFAIASNHSQTLQQANLGKLIQNVTSAVHRPPMPSKA